MPMIISSSSAPVMGQLGKRQMERGSIRLALGIATERD
jgi:hypothetical protein